MNEKDPRYSHAGTGGDVREFRKRWPDKDNTSEFWCSLCVLAPRKRRNLCWSCYRKLRHAGVVLPENITLFKLILAAIVRLPANELEQIRSAIV